MREKSRLVSALRFVSQLCGLGAAALGLAAFTGWLLAREELHQAFAGGPTITANASLGLFLAGVALVLVVRPGAPAWIPPVFAVPAALLGALALVEYAFGVPIGANELIAADPGPTVGTGRPGLMALNTAIGLLLVSLAIVMLDLETRIVGFPAQYAALAAGAFSVLGLTQYLYGEPSYLGLARFTGMALPTSIGLTALSVGALFARPNRGLMRIVTSESDAGTLARRLLLPAVLLPLAIGFFVDRGIDRASYDVGFGVSLFAGGTIAMFTALVWATALAVLRSEEEREASAEEQKRLERSEREARALASTQQAEIRGREEILAIVSHDLRNLLAPIGTGALVIERRTDDEKLRKLASTIGRTADRMNGLISDLLDLAALSEGRLSIALAPEQPGEMVYEVIDAQRPLAQARGLELIAAVAEGTPAVRCDRRRVLQILSNLVANALKFTEAGSISISVEPAGDDVLFSVRDTGVGMTPEEQQRIFERYWMARPASSRGSGLGLSIAHGLVEAQGGRIWLASEEGKGSTFFFTLPVA